ncbi:MAG: GNAT family N-acetyltransferase [Myxococcales bacterium]
MAIVRPVESENELEQILALQRRNLARNLDAEEVAAQGFVTVEHTLDVLQRMHSISPSIVAREGEALAGYALVMPPECRAFVPVLVPMFERLDQLGARDYYIMGQICIDKPYRGQGVFDELYAAHERHLSGRYRSCITEVATRNRRSMNAHLRVGFTVMERYRDATDDWALLEWRWA